MERQVRVITTERTERPDVGRLLEENENVELNSTEPFAPYSRDSTLDSAVFTVETNLSEEELVELVKSYFDEYGGLSGQDVVEVFDSEDAPW